MSAIHKNFRGHTFSHVWVFNTVRASLSWSTWGLDLSSFINPSQNYIYGALPIESPYTFENLDVIWKKHHKHIYHPCDPIFIGSLCCVFHLMLLLLVLVTLLSPLSNNWLRLWEANLFVRFRTGWSGYFCWNLSPTIAIDWETINKLFHTYCTEFSKL